MKAIFKSKWLYAALVAGAAWWYFGSPASNAERIEYQTAALSTGTVESIVNTAGSLSPLSIVEVGSEVSGLIRELNADFNSVVNAGDLLARIDDRDVRTVLRQREADLEVSKANLVQEKSALLRAQTDADFAQRELERSESLRERNLISETDLENAVSRVRSAEASLESAKSRIISAQANILQREAQLEQTQLDLERTYIRSPVDGVVINRLVDLGQAVNANQSIPTLFEVAQDLSSMQIEASIDEANIGKIQEGLPVRFRVDAYPDERFSGVVTQVRKAATNTNNVVTYTVIINAENPDETLLPGMTASVDVVLGSRRNVLRAPNAALRFTPPAGVGSGGSGGDARMPGGGTDRAAEMASQLSLTEEQEQKFAALIEENAQELRVVMQQQQDNPFGFDRNAMSNLRSKLENQLKLVLNEEQMASYRQLSAPAGGGRAGFTPGGATQMERGEIWVLRNGEPVQLSIRTGLSDVEYTEIQSDELQAGDEVIVRAVYFVND